MKTGTLTTVVIGLAAALASCPPVASSDAPAPTPARRVDPQLTIDGVGLGTSLAAVRARLGPPREETADSHDPDLDMGMGPGKTLRYDGVVIEVCKPSDDSDFHVWRMIVTGASRKLSTGVHVGMARRSAVRAIGPPESTSREDQGVEVLHYTFRGFDGWYWLKIENDAVTEIGMAEDWS